LLIFGLRIKDVFRGFEMGYLYVMDVPTGMAGFILWTILGCIMWGTFIFSKLWLA
jgi:hypothetical protein